MLTYKGHYTEATPSSINLTSFSWIDKAEVLDASSTVEVLHDTQLDSNPGRVATSQDEEELEDGGDLPLALLS